MYYTLQEILNKQSVSLMQIDPEHNPDIPLEVDNYHNLFPLEPPVAHVRKSSTFGYQTSVYKATNTKDGMLYCLRRIHGKIMLKYLLSTAHIKFLMHIFQYFWLSSKMYASHVKFSFDHSYLNYLQPFLSQI